VHRLLKTFIYGGNVPRNAHVRVTAVTNKGPLHTFVGLLGHCSKDSNEPHYREIRVGVTDFMIAAGKDIYVLQGSAGNLP
jgi:hypothetical protein